VLLRSELGEAKEGEPTWVDVWKEGR
jgi:hypothetical protein